MQWQKYNTGIYLRGDDKFTQTVIGIIFIDIDKGLSWNPRGKQFSSPGKGEGWVWGSPKEKTIIKYIKKLYKKDNYFPILTSISQTKETQQVISEMIEDLEYCPLTILGLEIDEAQNLLLKLQSQPLKNYDIFSIPTLSQTIEGLNLNDLKISAEDNFPDPAIYELGILIGQQGSGKSNYANFLKEKGYIIINEKEAEKIRNKRTQKSIRQFKEEITKVLNHEKRGIIIDATNPSLASRVTYNEIAGEMEIPVVNLWLSKSGFDYNSKRSEPISKIGLFHYAKNLQLPDNYIRIL